MSTDKAPADSATSGYAGSGDAGRGRVEHRSFRHVEFTQSVRNSLSGTRGSICPRYAALSPRIRVFLQYLQ